MKRGVVNSGQRMYKKKLSLCCLIYSQPLNPYLCKNVRKKVFKAADDIFGLGLHEYDRILFYEKTDYNHFIMLFREPKIIYDEWIQMFKGENSIEELIEKAIGSNHRLFLENMKRNDPLRIVTAL